MERGVWLIPPIGSAIASLTVMLWILWSESLRARKPSPLLYSVRVLLYLTVSAILVWNMVQYPAQFNFTSRAVSILAVLVGVGGAAFFSMRLVKRARTGA